MFALVDCNNFYCACERLFDPTLKGKPIVVLSNNDGCIISRSAEAKEVGLKMTTPIHHVADLVRRHDVRVFSSNYTLYQDISDRVMDTLKTLAPRVEVYSIDEAFIDLSNLGFAEDLDAYGRHIKRMIEQWVGVPVCVGIAPTKTLAKLANSAAKKYPATGGVVDLSDPRRADRLLALSNVRELWGVGKRQSKKLQDLGIHTAAQLKQTPAKRIRKHFSVVLERTLRELSGEVCIPLEVETESRKHILCSRSFGIKQRDISQVTAALASHVHRAAAKLRRDGSLAGAIKVSLKTNPYSPDDAQYANKASVELAIATDDSIRLLQHAQQLLHEIWKPGYNYHKVGVVLSDLRPKAIEQTDLLDDDKAVKQRQLMRVIDQLNGANKLVIRQAASMHADASWQMRRERLSRAYTTRWDELPEAS